MENERGRAKVETRNLCERKNGRGVDTNRNWPVHWGFKEPDYDAREEYPGDEPLRCLSQPVRLAKTASAMRKSPASGPRSLRAAFWLSLRSSNRAKRITCSRPNNGAKLCYAVFDSA